MKRQPGTATSPAPAAEPVARVLSRQARPGHERAFEEVLHSLAGAVAVSPATWTSPCCGLPPAARPSTPPCHTAGILPLLELVSYLLSRLAALPAWARPLISVVIVIPLMQYVVMPLLTHAAPSHSTYAPATAPAANTASRPCAKTSARSPMAQIAPFRRDTHGLARPSTADHNDAATGAESGSSGRVLSR